MSVCAAPTCSHQSFDGSSYYVDVDVEALPKYIYLSPPLIFPTTYNGIRTKKNIRCESLRALLPYAEWDQFVTLAGSNSGLRVTLSYLV